MSKFKMIKSILKENGIGWAAYRILYSLKLKTMRAIPLTEKWYEKSVGYPKRLDLFLIDVEALRSFLHVSLNNEEKKQLIETADKVCEGIIIGFSSIELHYGNPIDWQLNPLTGKRCDEKTKWYGIPDFDKERGDIKVIWEASRFSHFTTLARAFLLTGDEKYYRVFSSQLTDWLEKNPYGHGANFKCGQECSLRMVNALLAYTVFKKHGVATDADASNVKDLVDRCYRKVLSNFFYAHKCIKNNHTISELMGMIVGAWCCKDQKQLEKAYRLLDEVIGEQFTDDGGYCQFSFNYQRLVLQDLEVVMSIEGRTGYRLSEKSKDKVKNSAWLMFLCQDDSGDVPNYGSNDGALVFPVTSCGYRDFQPVINTIYALICGKQMYDSGNHQEELIWFSGGKNVQDYEVEKKRRESSQFPEAGLFTIRTPYSWMMVIANNYKSRPAHMDQLHVDLWVDGVNVLCDAGTFSYASEEGKKLSKNGSHNTVVVDGKAQMNSIGPFMVYDWTKREKSISDNNSFEGKIVSANGYSHIRRITNIGKRYEIVDNVDKNYTVAFHTPCEISRNEESIILSYKGKKLCTIRNFGEFEIQMSQRSLFYLKEDNTSCVLLHGNANTDSKTVIEIEERD